MSSDLCAARDETRLLDGYSLKDLRLFCPPRSEVIRDLSQELQERYGNRVQLGCDWNKGVTVTTLKVRRGRGLVIPLDVIVVLC